MTGSEQYDKTFDEFFDLFSKASEINQFIIYETMKMMDTSKSPKYKFKREIKYLLDDLDMTQDELLSELADIIKEDKTDGIKSMLQRNSLGSKYFPLIVEYFNVFEHYLRLHSEDTIQQNLDLKHIYMSLTPYNQDSICTLAYLLNHTDDIQTFINSFKDVNNSNYGIETDESIPFK